MICSLFDNMDGNKKKIKIVSDVVFRPKAGRSASPNSPYWSFSEVTADDLEPEYPAVTVFSTPDIAENDIDAERLIEAVRNREALWDCSNPNYKNRTMRPNLWKEVAREINYSELLICNIRKRWDNIKSGYMRTKAGVPSGACMSGKKDYKYGRLLSFLDDKYEPRRTITTMSPCASPSTSTDNSWSTPTPSSFEVPYTPKRKAESVSINLKRRALEAIENRPKKSESAEDSFGNFIALELKSLPEPYKAEFQFDIIKSLFNIKKKIHES